MQGSAFYAAWPAEEGTRFFFTYRLFRVETEDVAISGPRELRSWRSSGREGGGYVHTHITRT